MVGRQRRRFAWGIVALIGVAAAPVRAQTEGPELPAALLGPAYGEAELALAPVLTKEPQRSALAALQRNDFKAAARLLSAVAKDAPTRWLKATALRGAGRPAEARKIFELLAADGGPLSDRAFFQAGMSALEMGDAPAAEQLLAQVSLRSVDAADAMLERARQLMRLRPSGPALARLVDASLEPLMRGRVRGDPAAAFLLAGDAWNQAGDRETARERWRSAWVDRPLSPAAGSARARERSLPPGTKIPNEKLVRRAEILLDAHQNKEAIDSLLRLNLPSLCTLGCPGDRTPAGLLQSALSVLAPQAMPQPHQLTPEDIARQVDPADPLVCRSRLAIGRGYRKMRDYAKARTFLAPVVLRCADPDVRSRALFILAQLDTLAQKPSAGPLWEALRFAFPTSSLADDALVYQAQARRRAGDAEGQRKLLTTLVNEDLTADTRPEALFQLYWSLRSEGRAREGLVWLDQLAALPDGDGSDEERARYWRATTLLEALQDPAQLSPAEAGVAHEAARADLVWLVEDRPLTWYGLLARTRLFELDPELATRTSELQAQHVEEGLAQTAGKPLHAGSLAQDPHLLAGVELLKLGFKADAAKELNAVDRSAARAAGEAGEEPMVLMADLLTRAADLRAAHNIVRGDLRSLLRRPSHPLALRAASLAYPRAFRAAVEKAAKAAKVQPDLLQALMREESALDPKALSSTGALGLTQLMPATALEVARHLHLKGYSTQMLMDPETNIRVGGAYLGQLLQQLGHPALALAAYNAGAGTVTTWLKARGTLPLDAFVEEIPLDETRGYVKRCLRSYAAYRFLAPGSEGTSRMAKVGQKLATRSM
ncbi:MAG: transglycosylase SLT domain-containing protein [Deltaproteobacteria bacterium]|nr:transglycosylase SLT domain-containing protein [Deltaproteobacteria bacterium]